MPDVCLNAYGLSASEAEKVMDQFVQTQNDGKIVVAEYAQNIGKVVCGGRFEGAAGRSQRSIAQATAAGGRLMWHSLGSNLHWHGCFRLAAKALEGTADRCSISCR